LWPSTHAVIEPQGNVAIRIRADVVLSRLVEHIIGIKRQRVWIGGEGNWRRGEHTLDWDGG
jgi:hypothetical protein